ncbi:hypothetical protein CRI93_12875 [Longimonas halophila]|uniref:Uncharacterized protein n=1 Tax=Longimonas halophila TaxID=1469170 RepID=A0A2H3NJ22_9BACT|nr:hypothetical protein [Longimonas halophila]PEN05405.1 hypothetical protein CRI93_12875 [Longimonas halophila]
MFARHVRGVLWGLCSSYYAAGRTPRQLWRYYERTLVLVACLILHAVAIMDAQFWLITIPTLLIFFSLAAALLVPIWRFLDREQEVSKQWTPEAVARRIEEQEEEERDEESASEDKPARSEL